MSLRRQLCLADLVSICVSSMAWGHTAACVMIRRVPTRVQGHTDRTSGIMSRQACIVDVCTLERTRPLSGLFVLGA